MEDDSFLPKQALSKDPTLYASITAGTTTAIAQKCLSLLPPLTPDSIVHDNGCGAGEVTETILAAVTAPAPVSQTSTTTPKTNTNTKTTTPTTTPTIPKLIHATDIDPHFLTPLRTKVLSNSWPVTVTSLPAESLSTLIPPSTFTHSISNFVLFLTPQDGIPAVQETYRTLRSPTTTTSGSSGGDGSGGGAAAFTSWALLPHWEVVAAAHAQIRPDAAERPLREIPRKWFDGEYLREQVIKGGFEADKTRLERADVDVFERDLERWAGIVWSWLGRPVGGWRREDEEQWEEAIKAVRENVRRMEGFKDMGDGGVRIRLRANVVVARK